MVRVRVKVKVVRVRVMVRVQSTEIHVFDIRLCILIFTFNCFFSKFDLSLNDFQFNTVYKDEQGEVVDTRFLIFHHK